MKADSFDNGVLAEIIGKGVHCYEPDATLAVPELLAEGKGIGEEIGSAALPFYPRPVTAEAFYNQAFYDLIVGIDIPAVFEPADPLGDGIDIIGDALIQLNGRPHVLEFALKADVALVEAWQADRWGNLTFRKSGRNFNPVMATAAKCTIVQAQHVVELGELDPETVVTPGIFVDRVLHVPYGDPPV